MRAVAQKFVMVVLFPVVMVGAVYQVASTAFLVGADWAGDQLDDLMED